MFIESTFCKLKKNLFHNRHFSDKFKHSAWFGRLEDLCFQIFNLVTLLTGKPVLICFLNHVWKTRMLYIASTTNPCQKYEMSAINWLRQDSRSIFYFIFYAYDSLYVHFKRLTKVWLLNFKWSERYRRRISLLYKQSSSLIIVYN